MRSFIELQKHLMVSEMPCCKIPGNSAKSFEAACLLKILVIAEFDKDSVFIRSISYINAGCCFLAA